jgi:hypothetical protein
MATWAEKLSCRQNDVSKRTLFDTLVYLPRCIKKPSRWLYLEGFVRRKNVFPYAILSLAREPLIVTLSEEKNLEGKASSQISELLPQGQSWNRYEPMNQSQNSALSYGLIEESALHNEFWDRFANPYPHLLRRYFTW